MKSPLNISSKHISEMAHNSSIGLIQGIDFFSGGIINISAILANDTRKFPFDFKTEVTSNSAVDSVRADGCGKILLDKLERSCLDKFERLVTQSQSIVDDAQKTTKICCAIADYEKCSLRAYNKANCGADKEEVQNHINAVTTFMTFFVSRRSCTEFRGQCAMVSSSRAIIVSWMVLLPLGLMLIY
ncbi:uncharacterized protein LOC118184874 isoform X2 [Stegodyphus dumicola]|nr:uncharacterized protein LOC118184874 isoform X2 [Stegodyphus dumicola]